MDRYGSLLAGAPLKTDSSDSAGDRQYQVQLRPEISA